MKKVVIPAIASVRSDGFPGVVLIRSSIGDGIAGARGSLC